MTAVKFCNDGSLADLLLCGSSNHPIFLEIIPTTGEIVRNLKFITTNISATYVHANSLFLGGVNNPVFTLTSPTET